MGEISILIGGITGSGANEAGALMARVFNRLGYNIYMYHDYPSRVQGGHSFALLRAADRPISAHSQEVDLVIALDQESLDLHRSQWKTDTIIIYDSERLSLDAPGQPQSPLPLTTIITQSGAPRKLGIMALTGAGCKSLGISLELLLEVLQKHSPADAEHKTQLASRGHTEAREHRQVTKLDRPARPVMSGSQATALGLVKAGLQAYVAYPMTPTSPILEYLAATAPEFGLQVMLPESEIGVMLMALGYSYMGVRTALGTSGGGFSLMVEGLSLSGQAELPVVIIMGQRAGPSTGMPTKTAQTDLHFILHAGQGEFPRLIVAPGDAEEAYYWSGVALNKAWQYQLPAFVLSDKTLGLSLYDLDTEQIGGLQPESPLLWDGHGTYRRYADSPPGISPLAFPPLPGQIVKINSYVHDEDGITTEDPLIAAGLADRRIRKEESLAADLKAFATVKVYGQGTTALLCWGSNKGVCCEIAAKLGLKVIQVLVLCPFPRSALAAALEGVERLIGVECNATGQLATLLAQYGFQVDQLVRKYDGRPFSLQELEKQIREVIK